jgi:hypothetical protein
MHDRDSRKDVVGVCADPMHGEAPRDYTPRRRLQIDNKISLLDRPVYSVRPHYQITGLIDLSLLPVICAA